MGFIERARYFMAVKTFHLWERLGLHVVPAHFYFPIPESRDLSLDLFNRRSEMTGVEWNISRQLNILRGVFKVRALEVPFPQNAGLSEVDAAILHAMIRHFQPAKVIEVGSGQSTRFAARAALMNQDAGVPCELVAIEPYPDAGLVAGIAGLTRLRQQKVQEVEFAEFAGCDLLFIDSSHVVKMGGDVTFLILEVLPRLKAGCIVHFHDILLPGEYWKEWVVRNRLFWTEQYLLHAFLAYNSEFEILWGSRFMQLEHPQEIASAFPFYRREHRITSFWIQRRITSPDLNHAHGAGARVVSAGSVG
jgi:predicted O-methyltransferase YrrM